MSKEGIGVKEWILIGILAPIFLFAVQNIGYITNPREIKKLKSMTVQELRAYIKTPEQFRFYERYCLDTVVSYDLKSPERTHEDGEGDCGDRALKAYYDLGDDGYANTFIEIDIPGLRHLLLYYETYRKGYGGLHKRYNVLGDGDPTEYNSLESIARAHEGKRFRLLRFNPEAVPDWVTTKENLGIEGAWITTREYQKVK